MKRSEIENRKKLLDYKKSQFLSAVEESAEHHGFPTPRVYFWETYAPEHFTQGERAHIHIESNTICISEMELEIMTLEDIEETTSHEVSHLRNLSHNIDFQNIKEETKVSLWKPPTGEGVVVIDSRDDEPVKKEKLGKKPRVVKGRCNYHLCKKKEKTYQCKYCENYYCKKHKEPIEPDLSASFSVGELKGHPCLVYSNYLRDEKQKQNKEYKKALEKMFNRKKKEEDIYEASLKRLKSKKEEEKKESFWDKIKNFFSS